MPAPAPIRVLLVEDDDAYATMITMELAAGAGIAVTRVSTLTRALSTLAASSFDAILLDLALPDSTSLETVDRIHAVASSTPIVVLTGQEDDEAALRAVQRGAQDYLLKGDTNGRLLLRAIRYARERASFRTQLTAREARFRSLVEFSSDGIALVSESLVSLYHSRSVERVSGYTPDELLGKRMDLFAHPDDIPAVKEQFLRCMEHPGQPVTIEFRFQHKDGSWRWGEGVIVNRLDDPAIQAIVVNHRDVTERKVAEQALRVSEQRLRQALKMEAVGRLAGGVAHDFNNVLTAIFGYSDLLRDQMAPDDPKRADLDEIRRSAERAASLTRQLLAFSRKQVMQPRLLLLNEVVTSVQKLLATLVGDDILLQVSLHPELWQVKADPGQIEQVLMNLAANARDAMPEGGRLAIETANAPVAENAGLPDVAPGDYVRLSVCDSGCGMSESVRCKIFEPFFTTKEPGKGTGLGLATVYGVVQQTGGAIDVQSEEGKGTRFDIYLPRVP